MTCTGPSCRGERGPRNRFGVCAGCMRQPVNDPADDGRRIASVFDEPYPGAQNELDQRHLTETAAPRT